MRRRRKREEEGMKESSKMEEWRRMVGERKEDRRNEGWKDS